MPDSVVTLADRYRWQRRATGVLDALLEHGQRAELPPLVWTLASTGALTGEAAGLGSSQVAQRAAVADRPAPEPMTPADVAAHDLASYVRPSRRLVAAGVKRGTGPLIVEQPPHVDFTLAVAR